jgi:hypothetical protein
VTCALLGPLPISNLPIVMIAGVVGFAGNEAVALSEEVRHRLLHQVRRLDTAVIYVNPCGALRRRPARDDESSRAR